MKVGTLVKLKVPCLGNEAGAQGVCFDVYQLGDYPPGAQIIFENGNYDGFSQEEQAQFLEEMCDTSFQYEFTHVIQLGNDFRAGVFDYAFMKEDGSMGEDKEHNFADGVRGAVVPMPEGKVKITLRLDQEIIDYFRDKVEKKGSGNYLEDINNFLRAHINNINRRNAFYSRDKK